MRVISGVEQEAYMPGKKPSVLLIKNTPDYKLPSH